MPTAGNVYLLLNSAGRYTGAGKPGSADEVLFVLSSNQILLITTGP